MPKTSPKAYQRSNPVPLAGQLRSELLLIHGMADDNVLLEHTLKLAHALQEAGRPFRQMLYPGKKHSIKGSRTRRHLLGDLCLANLVKRLFDAFQLRALALSLLIDRRVDPFAGVSRFFKLFLGDVCKLASHSPLLFAKTCCC